MWRLRNWWSSKDDRILPLPLEYPTPLPVPSLAVSAEFNQLSWLIYPQIYQTGYGRFRPNKSDDHSSCRYYRGGWHRSFPALIPIPINSKEKRYTMCIHLEFPHHSFLQCEVFAPAAPRRVRIRVSESVSGLCLPTPVRVDG